MAVTIRPCIVCRCPMKCNRSNKYCCSNLCHSRLHKRRIKLGLTTKEIIELYREEIETSNNQQPIEEIS